MRILPPLTVEAKYFSEMSVHTYHNTSLCH